MPDRFTLHPQDVPLLDVFAHDLRSPLLGVRGCLSELAHAITALPGGEALCEDVEEITDGIREVEALLAGLLAICRRSRPRLAIRPVDMNALIADAAAQVTARHPQAEIVAADLPPCRGDQGMLADAFARLLDNAVRAGGPVTVDGQVGERVEYTITDRGPGLSPTMRHEAFTLFAADGPGDGIGLSLARHAIILHRGWLRLHSSEGGCTAQVSLPR